MALRQTSNFGPNPKIVFVTRIAACAERYGVTLRSRFILRSELLKMKAMKFIFVFAALALGAANAASGHSVDLKKPVTVGTAQLQPGSYKVEMQGDKAVFKSGKNVVEVPATLGKSDRKFGTNGIVTIGSQLVEIDLGGTSDKIVFSPATGMSAGGK